MDRSHLIVFYNAQGEVVDTRGCDPRNQNAISDFANKLCVERGYADWSIEPEESV